METGLKDSLRLLWLYKKIFYTDQKEEIFTFELKYEWKLQPLKETVFKLRTSGLSHPFCEKAALEGSESNVHKKHLYFFYT